MDIGRGFGTSQIDAFQDHTHSTVVQWTSDITHAKAGSTAAGGYRSPNNIEAGYATGTSSSGNHGIETRPRNVALLPCIKM